MYAVMPGLARATLLVALMAGASSTALAQAPPAAGDPHDARIELLEHRVRELAAEVEALRRGRAEQILTLAKVESQPAARAVIAGGRPGIASADGAFTANFHAIVHLDAAQYDQAPAGPSTRDFRRDGPALGASAGNVDLAHARRLKNGDDFRRARIGVDGTMFTDWDYRLIFDFGGSGAENAGQLYEAWVRYSGLKPFRVRIGAFAPSIGLEDQGSTNAMPFLERSVSSDLARGLAAGETRTAAEAFVASDHWRASLALTGRTVGAINPAAAAAVPQTYADQLGLVGRLAATPLHGADWLVHVGVHGSYVIRPPDATGPTPAGPTAPSSSVISFASTPELRVDATKLINTGAISARHADTIGAEFAVQKRNLLLQTEYEKFGVERSDGLSSPGFGGYYIEGLWTITGERRQYNAQTAAFDAPPVARPFQLNGGGWGAWEVGLRYSEMDLNYRPGAPGAPQTGSAIRGGYEQNLTAGLNWYPNSAVRFMFDYAHVRITRLSPATSPASASAIWFAPIGARIGQTYNVFEMRAQFAF